MTLAQKCKLAGVRLSQLFIGSKNIGVKGRADARLFCCSRLGLV